MISDILEQINYQKYKFLVNFTTHFCDSEYSKYLDLLGQKFNEKDFCDSHQLLHFFIRKYLIIKTMNQQNTSFNSIQIFLLIRWVSFIVFIALISCCYVHFKNQEYLVGNKIRAVEDLIRATNKKKEVLQVKITTLTSRQFLQKRLDIGLIKLEQINDASIVHVRYHPLFHSLNHDTMLIKKHHFL